MHINHSVLKRVQMIKGHMQNMSRFVIAIATVAALCVGCAPAEASIVVTVDKSAQRLSVAIDGSLRYQWPVSTARWGYSTPNGSYRPEWLARKWFSRKYDWSPMPYSIFFNGGYAIHGSYEIAHLGRPASHGCIRLRPTKRCHPIRAGQRAYARDEYSRYRGSADALRRKMAVAILTTVFVENLVRIE